jgi:manganese/zinc/iron transport system permease protein
VLGTLRCCAGARSWATRSPHAALPGVCVAFLAPGSKDPTTLVVGAAFAGIVGAFLMVGIERTSRIRPDAAIGVVLSASSRSDRAADLHHARRQRQPGRASSATCSARRRADDLRRAGHADPRGGRLLVVACCLRPLRTTLFDAEFAGSIGPAGPVLELGMTPCSWSRSSSACAPWGRS